MEWEMILICQIYLILIPLVLPYCALTDDQEIAALNLLPSCYSHVMLRKTSNIFEVSWLL